LRRKKVNVLEESHDRPLAVVCFGEGKGAWAIEYLGEIEVSKREGKTRIQEKVRATRITHLIIHLMLLPGQTMQELPIRISPSLPTHRFRDLESLEILQPLLLLRLLPHRNPTHTTIRSCPSFTQTYTRLTKYP
jgi:hypothetical protein